MAAPASTPLPPIHVLVVEAETRDRGQFPYLRKSLGDLVRRVETARQALEAARESPGLEVVVLCRSHREPGCLDLVGSLRAVHPEVGVVLVSPDTDPCALDRALQAEVDEFVVEPVEPEYVHEVVREMMLGQALCGSPLQMGSHDS